MVNMTNKIFSDKSENLEDNKRILSILPKLTQFFVIFVVLIFLILFAIASIKESTNRAMLECLKSTNNEAVCIELFKK